MAPCPRIGRLGQSAMTVLINGSSGTGKERVARVLHRKSTRADKPLVTLIPGYPGPLITPRAFGKDRRYPVTNGWVPGG